MNKKLFWAGITFQGIHLFLMVTLGLSFIDWSFLTTVFFIGLTYVLFNLATLAMIFIGALSNGKDANISGQNKSCDNKY